MLLLRKASPICCRVNILILNAIVVAKAVVGKPTEMKEASNSSHLLT